MGLLLLCQQKLVTNLVSQPVVCLPTASSIRREEGAVKRLRGRGCFTVAASTAPALLGQV